MFAMIRRLAAIAVLAASLITPAMAEEGKRSFFYNITTDDTWAAGMAAGQANKALEAGHDVVLFLNVRAVYLASTARQQDTFAAAGQTPQELLQAAMDKGGRVIICPMCMRQAGMTMDDVIEGVERGGPDVTFKALDDPDTVVLSY
jgi:predicted peroxiredoxin